jgi:hypothetical protein
LPINQSVLDLKTSKEKFILRINVQILAVVPISSQFVLSFLKALNLKESFYQCVKQFDGKMRSNLMVTVLGQTSIFWLDLFFTLPSTLFFCFLVTLHCT